MGESGEIADWFDRKLIEHLSANMMMDDKELNISNRRSESYYQQLRDYIHEQGKKYGYDGGPSPAAICRDPFVPHE